MASRYEIIFSGAGGQGLIQAGTLLGESAVKTGELYASCTQAYGVASRGGFARSEVVIGDSEVTYPFALEPNVVIHLTAASWRQLARRHVDRTLVVVDESFAAEVSGRFWPVPLLKVADQLGRRQDANMVAVGLATAVLRVLPVEAVQATIAARFGADNHRLTAINAGWELGLNADRPDLNL